MALPDRGTAVMEPLGRVAWHCRVPRKQLCRKIWSRDRAVGTDPTSPVSQIEAVTKTNQTNMAVVNCALYFVSLNQLISQKSLVILFSWSYYLLACWISVMAGVIFFFLQAICLLFNTHLSTDEVERTVENADLPKTTTMFCSIHINLIKKR